MEFDRLGDSALLAALDEGFDAAGPTGAMRGLGEVLAARASESYVEPFNIAGAFARAGAVEETLFWLEKAVENGSYEMTYIAFWPHLDFIRDNKRYQDLLERVYGQRAQDIRKLACVSL